MADPTMIDQANYLLWAAHNLERAADRVINLCERVIYMVTGEIVEISGKGIREYN
jgi:phosphate transport system protein